MRLEESYHTGLVSDEDYNQYKKENTDFINNASQEIEKVSQTINAYNIIKNDILELKELNKNIESLNQDEIDQRYSLIEQEINEKQELLNDTLIQELAGLIASINSVEEADEVKKETLETTTPIRKITKIKKNLWEEVEKYRNKNKAVEEKPVEKKLNMSGFTTISIMAITSSVVSLSIIALGLMLIK